MDQNLLLLLLLKQKFCEISQLSRFFFSSKQIFRLINQKCWIENYLAPMKYFCLFPIDKIGSYQCQCADGYSGEFCQTKIPYCSTPEFSPCQNGGKCIDHFTHYTCECKLGFAGENCTTNINDCVDHMCQVCIFCFKMGLANLDKLNIARLYYLVVNYIEIIQFHEFF